MFALREKLLRLEFMLAQLSTEPAQITKVELLFWQLQLLRLAKEIDFFEILASLGIEPHSFAPSPVQQCICTAMLYAQRDTEVPCARLQ